LFILLSLSLSASFKAGFATSGFFCIFAATSADSSRLRRLFNPVLYSASGEDEVISTGSASEICRINNLDGVEKALLRRHPRG
jgi:hypothetical protein